MTAQPNWAPVDDDTADLLSVLADDGTLATEREWDLFRFWLQAAAELRGDGMVHPNDLRGMLRGEVKPQRVGAFTTRAISQRLIAWRGHWETSDDTKGRNSGKPAKCYVWVGS